MTTWNESDHPRASQKGVPGNGGAFVGKGHSPADDVTLGASTAAPEPFVFNGRYQDNEQVRHLYPEYAAVRADLEEKGAYPYNDSFKGRLPSLATTNDDSEDTAIYLLQTMHSLDEVKRDVQAFRDAGGYEAADIPVGEVRRGTLARYGWYMGGTGWQTYENVRVTRDTRGRVLLKEPRQRSWRTISDGGTFLMQDAIA
ncbi:hypothetical protein [Curtobacterium sp. MCBD17_040]|uniref:hypothetical protein n=1 Tax=Curtobacterium sp. MCBD17_040 TaxID=2175674 RepID=UPI0011B74A58|nr:hypothetical protein [Curtobacterium sp. MCBD17_040]WIB65428.1 hypothetical protein DEI94_18655 [Curtobacterium sp. MCBD17_040]